MSWVYLLLAGITEIGWPVGLKMAQTGASKWQGILFALVCMAVSGTFLWLAQREIPMGTAYAVWTGIGASGTFLLGVWLYGDPTSLMRYAGVMLILLGVVVLKLAHA
jgi:quaternary ammonium compound-resistance protein SugE